jgi:diaminohydroxyphosphoribosylaminopyrimidine deaminase / 5-amino-6-(5-phosphoribosylamino)uracil reductase
MSTKLSRLNKNSYFMNLALNQAKINLGNTKENPSVGCVIVKNDNVIALGHTSINGRPHAEQNAINFNKFSKKNSSLYATLEPCSNFGKTPPCVKSIIRNKIKKVFFSINDPDKQSFNKCKNSLNKAGLKVFQNLLSKEINYFYRSYVKSRNNFFPFVTCKIAVSKDFYTINKKKKWITNNYSRGRVHLMRSQHDSIITSSKTINDDNPSLNCRIDGLKRRNPSILIIDKNLKIKMNSKIIKKAKENKTIIFYNKFNKNKIKLLKSLNVRTYKISLDEENLLDLQNLLIKAKAIGFNRIFLEAGSSLTLSFLKKKLIDDLKIFVSNKNIGKNGLSNIKKRLFYLLNNKKGLEEKVNLFGEKLISYKLL